MTLILSNADVEQVLSIGAFMPVLEDAYRELAEGRGVSRTTSECFAPTPHADALYALKTMDGVIPKFGVSATRLTSDIVSWPRDAHGMRSVKTPAAPGDRYTGLVLLFSTTTGEPLCIMPDGFIQRCRVGAAGGLGVKYMAREDARTIGLIGTGHQARGQLIGACAARAITSVRCYSPNKANRETFARTMTQTLGIPVIAVESAEAAVADVDIVMCATNSYGSVFFARWLRPGQFVSSIKLPEIERAAFARCDHIAVHSHDTTSHFFSTRGLAVPKMEITKPDPEQPQLDVKDYPTLPDLIAGKAKGRSSAEDVTCFLNNMGLGFQFAAAGWFAYNKAKEHGLGRKLPTEWLTEDVAP